MIEMYITPNIWLQLSGRVRHLLAKEFNMKRSGQPYCITQAGSTTIESDGHTMKDLLALNVDSMKAWLGIQEEYNSPYSIFELFQKCAEKAEKQLEPLQQSHVQENQEIKEVVKENIEKKPFCDFCSSKGVKHLKSCTKKL